MDLTELWQLKWTWSSLNTVSSCKCVGSHIDLAWTEAVTRETWAGVVKTRRPVAFLRWSLSNSKDLSDLESQCRKPEETLQWAGVVGEDPTGCYLLCKERTPSWLLSQWWQNLSRMETNTLKGCSWTFLRGSFEAGRCCWMNCHCALTSQLEFDGSTLQRVEPKWTVFPNWSTKRSTSVLPRNRSKRLTTRV